MSESNPYQPPAPAAVPVKSTPVADGPVSSRAVETGRGWDWIVEGFNLFKKTPGIWILNVVIFFVVAGVVSVVPFIGRAAGILLAQILMGGLMLGCRALEDDGKFEIEHLFAGFSNRTGDLVVLGVLALVGSIVALIPTFLIVGAGSFLSMLLSGSLGYQLGAMGLTFMLGMLVALALMLPLSMALWFAPALIVLNGLKPVDAMKASFSGCLKNIVPFLVYGVVMLVLCFVAAIPLGLGFLVLGPVAIASIYKGYRDIFAAA